MKNNRPKCKNRFIVIFITLLLAFGSIYAIKNTSLDAIPDLSANQVIIEVEWSNQSAKDNRGANIISTNFKSYESSKIETIRAMSSFSTSMIYVIFKDGVDLYDARSRILEQLSTLQGTFPALAKVKLGPDASGVGWAYEYALKSKNRSLDELRTLQDYFYKFALLGVDGVSEVASVGGYVRNYEITLNQDRLIQYDLDIEEIKDAITKKIIMIVEQE